jgi:hypothetical protein
MAKALDGYAHYLLRRSILTPSTTAPVMIKNSKSGSPGSSALKPT